MLVPLALPFGAARAPPRVVTLLGDPMQVRWPASLVRGGQHVQQLVASARGGQHVQQLVASARGVQRAGRVSGVVVTRRAARGSRGRRR